MLWQRADAAASSSFMRSRQLMHWRRILALRALYLVRDWHAQSWCIVVDVENPSSLRPLRNNSPALRIARRRVIGKEGVLSARATTPTRATRPRETHAAAQMHTQRRVPP